MGKPRAKSLRVMILGASGVFGSRLAKLASDEIGVDLVLAARNLPRLNALADSLPITAICRAIDRDKITAHDLAGMDLVIDAAGPFQSSHMRVVESCIAAGVTYLDLADGREFVRDFSRFDEAAKGAETALITGASSIPALSHAVIEYLTENWARIDNLRVGIYPGNRAPRGLSVVESILSYVGKPVRVFRNGEWQEESGWGMTHREAIPGIGTRWASICDTPEQDLLVKRFNPTQSAEFFAGLELSVLHLGLSLMAQPVRWGWLKSLRSFANPMLAVAKWFLPFGSDNGAMTVRAGGVDGQGRPVSRVWVLAADANRGPNVPILAALAMIRRFRDRWRAPHGAYPCAGILDLSEFADDFARLGIRSSMDERYLTGKGFDIRRQAGQSYAA